MLELTELRRVNFISEKKRLVCIHKEGYRFSEEEERAIDKPNSSREVQSTFNNLPHPRLVSVDIQHLLEETHYKKNKLTQKIKGPCTKSSLELRLIVPISAVRDIPATR